MTFILAADTGGTFTDLVGFDAHNRQLFFAKALTNYDDLVSGVMACIAEGKVALRDVDVIKHGTTHVINTFLQRSGARTALVTTRGYRDTLEIARGRRPVPFQVDFRIAAPLVPRELRFEVDGRIDGKGEELVPLNETELVALAKSLASLSVDAVAISFLNAYLDPRHERRALEILQAHLPDLYICTGSDLSREWFEYERGATAAANAYVGPGMRRYVQGFDRRLRAEGFGRSFLMMASNGGVLSVDRAVQQPVQLVESGPIGGCIGAAAYGKALGIDRLIAFDMGGTTAKCSLVEAGTFGVEPIYYVGGYETGFPIRTPVLDIVEVGTGGGSIASVDGHGRLWVGPRSAGSEPGPVCFDRGGTEPTITDCNLILGRIGDGAFMNGRLALNRGAAEAALLERVGVPLKLTDSLDRLAHGVIEIAITQMAGAIREITIERARDPREFTLFAYGGGGGLHAVALARDLHIPTVIVPPQAGNFSALGMLLADARIDEAQTFLDPLSENALLRIGEIFELLDDRARKGLREQAEGAEILLDHHVELRYRGQKHPLSLPYREGDNVAKLRAKFLEAYKTRFGLADSQGMIEFMTVRVVGIARSEKPDLAMLVPLSDMENGQPASRRMTYFPEAGGRLDTAVFVRGTLPRGFSTTGPAIIEDYGATIVIGPREDFCVGMLGEIVISCGVRP